MSRLKSCYCWARNFTNVAIELLCDKFRNIDIEKVCSIIRQYNWNERRCSGGILVFSKVVTVPIEDEELLQEMTVLCEDEGLLPGMGNIVTKFRTEVRYCNLEPSVDYDALAERLDDSVLMSLGDNILSFVLTENLDFDEFLLQVRKNNN